MCIDGSIITYLSLTLDASFGAGTAAVDEILDENSKYRSVWKDKWSTSWVSFEIIADSQRQPILVSYQRGKTAFDFITRDGTTRAQEA
jgi:hypothetical protein